MRNRPLRDALAAGVGAVGLHTVRRTRRADVAALVESLQPLDSGHGLIRIGPDGDGGYLVPDDISGIEEAFSPGVSTESGFELDLSTRGMRVHMADYSVDGPAAVSPRFTFVKKFVGSFPTESTMTMDGWIDAKSESDGDLLLQMDIEGAEFEVLTNLSCDLLARFRILVVEFHYLHQLWNKPWFLQVSRVFEKLLMGHSVVHVHPNNCCGSFRSGGLEIPRVAEFTFLRNDRFRQREPRTDFPHALDRDNTGKPTLPLPTCWFDARETLRIRGRRP